MRGGNREVPRNQEEGVVVLGGGPVRGGSVRSSVGGRIREGKRSQERWESCKGGCWGEEGGERAERKGWEGGVSTVSGGVFVG